MNAGTLNLLCMHLAGLSGDLFSDDAASSSSGALGGISCGFASIMMLVQVMNGIHGYIFVDFRIALCPST